MPLKQGFDFDFDLILMEGLEFFYIRAPHGHCWSIVHVGVVSEQSLCRSLGEEFVSE
jgi:hypothetical protein